MTGYTFPGCLIAALCLFGCRDDDTPDKTCEDALCYPICHESLLNDYGDIGYIGLGRASCYSESQCSCSYRCIQSACAEHCQIRKGALDGYCQILTCSCVFAGDADADAGDADAGAVGGDDRDGGASSFFE